MFDHAIIGDQREADEAPAEIAEILAEAHSVSQFGMRVGDEVDLAERLAALCPRLGDMVVVDGGTDDAADAGGYEDPDHYLEEFGRRIGHALTREDWVTARREAMTPWPDMLALARRIGEQARTAIYTNNGPLTKSSIGTETVQIAGTVFNADSITIAAYIFYNLVFALLAYPIGIMGDRIGLKKIFIIGLFVFSLVYTGFAFNTSMTVFFILFFLYGVYAAATEGMSLIHI